MRSRRELFLQSFFLTLLLMVPIILTTVFFVRQRSQQQLVQQTAGEQENIPVERGAKDSFRLLLMVQRETPAFVLVRLDAPARRVTLCALPPNLEVSAPAGHTTLAECANAAGPGRVCQLLLRTLEEGQDAEETATLGVLDYLCATPDCWQSCLGATVSVRFDTAALLTADQWKAMGQQESIAVVTAGETEEFLSAMEKQLPTEPARANLRAALWEAFLRQNPAEVAALPAQLRQRSARLLTSLLAQDFAAVETTLDYLTRQNGVELDYCLLPCEAGKRTTKLTEEGKTLLRQLMA